MGSNKEKILCTKLLDASQLNQLQQNFDVVHFDLLEIIEIPVTISQCSDNIIFTSFKAAKIGIALLGEESREKNFFCVGNKTKELLEQLGLKVVRNEAYSKDLANVIVSQFPTEVFSYLCNENRLDELPDILNKNGVNVKQVITYTSRAVDVSDDDLLDAKICMWFSPMGVKSIARKVSKSAVAHYAIGETTAKELKEESIKGDKIYYPATPSVDGMIELINNRKN